MSMRRVESALKYIENGYKLVPVVPGGKRPHPKLAPNGVKNVSNDLEVIKSWFEENPDINIGLACEGSVVIDCDQGHDWNGYDKLKECDCPHQLTPGRGDHFVFKRPEGKDWGNSVGKIAKKIDTRADNGYLVVEPSRTENGDYQFQIPLPNIDELPYPPDWLIDELDQAFAPKVPASIETAPPSPSVKEYGPERLERAKKYLDAMQHAVSGCEGHNATYAASTALVHGFGLTLADAYQLMKDSYNPRCIPPWSDKELWHKVEDAATKPHDRPKGWLLQDSNSSNTEPVIVNMGNIESEDINWLWKNRIPRGKIALLAGDPGLGKSTAALDITAKVSTGASFPGTTESREPAGVVLLSAEDGLGDTIRPRLDAAGADVSRINVLTAVRQKGNNGDRERSLNLVQDINHIEAAIHATPNCQLVIIDPISAYYAGTNSHKDAEVRSLLAPLSNLAERTGVAIIGVVHLRKMKDKAIYSVNGSIGTVAAARSAWMVLKDPDDPQRRLFLPIKNNLAPDDNGLAFSLEPSGNVAKVVWEPDPVTVTVDEIFSNDGMKSSKLDEAVNWLSGYLSHDSKPSKQVRKDAKQHGITDYSLNCAKKFLGIKARPGDFGGPWIWELPNKNASSRDDSDDYNQDSDTELKLHCDEPSQAA